VIKLRSITIGTPLEFDEGSIESTKKAAEALNPRTFRVNLPILNLSNEELMFAKLDHIVKSCKKLGIRWFNAPFNLMSVNEQIPDFVLLLMKRQPNLFINLIVTKDNVIDYRSIMQASKIIKKISQSGQSGFNNFRVGISCNPCINTPFFPFSYSSDELGFSVALELPPLIRKILEEHKGKDMQEIRESIASKIIPEIKKLEEKCIDIENKTDAKYHGIDLSLAPFPEGKGSVGKLLEMLGFDSLGSNGTLFFTSFYTDLIKYIIKESSIKSVGFNGVMFSLMEDTRLCKCNNQNVFSIDSLISYAAVCGCGLDMVPIPGNIFEEELASMILDVAGLSTTLSKPLGVRVLPIPDKNEGEMTQFKMDFLCNTRIKKVKNIGIWGDSFKKKYFTYLTKPPRINGELVKEFWEQQAEKSGDKKEGTNLGLNSLEEDALKELKLEIEHEKIFSYANLKKNMTVLDLGSGSGEWSFEFAPKVNKVIAVDYSSKMHKQAKQKAKKEGIKNIVFYESPVQDFTNDENKFAYDIIFISGLLIYLNDEDLEKLIDNMKLYSKPGTELVLRDGTGIMGRYCLNNKYSEELNAHYSAIYRTREEYIRAFKKAGFFLVKDENMFPEDSKLNKFPETILHLYKFKRK